MKLGDWFWMKSDKFKWNEPIGRRGPNVFHQTPTSRRCLELLAAVQMAKIVGHNSTDM